MKEKETPPQIDYSVFILEPTEKFAQYLSEKLNESISVEEIAEETSAYLTPILEKEEDWDEYLKNNFQRLAKSEITAWLTDEENEEDSLSWEIFCDWFRVLAYPTLLDMT